MEINNLEKLASMVFDNTDHGDDNLFPNHTDKDIWMKGFIAGVQYKIKTEKQLFGPTERSLAASCIFNQHNQYIEHFGLCTACNTSIKKKTITVTENFSNSMSEELEKIIVTYDFKVSKTMYTSDFVPYRTITHEAYPDVEFIYTPELAHDISIPAHMIEEEINLEDELDKVFPNYKELNKE